MTARSEHNVGDHTSPDAGRPGAQPVANATRLAQAWGRRVEHTAQLAGVEASLAARSVPAILVLVVLAAGLSLSAWLAFAIGLAWLAVEQGVPVATIAGAAMAAHALLAAVALRAAEQLSDNLSLPRLRASLTRAKPEAQ